MRLIFILLLTINLFSKEILGEIDKFDLPLLNLQNIEARIDTGATSSSIHCTNIEKINNNMIKFKLLGKEEFIKPISKIANVKNSNGKVQSRFFIKTTIKIYNKDYEIELSLNNRENMKYPLLVGRELLNQGFIVDVSQKNLSFENKNKIIYKE